MERFANKPESTLSGSINNTVTSLSVASASSFPTGGTFRIAIGDELMVVTAVSGSTFTVIRGAEGTTASSHNSGVPVMGVLTAGSLAQYKADIVQGGSILNRPSAGTLGTMFLSDGALSRDNGTSWDDYGPIRQLTPPNVYTGWTHGRSSTSGNVTVWGPGYFNITQNSGEGSPHRLQTYVRPMPNTTNITIRAMVAPTVAGSTGFTGICFRDAGKILSWNYQYSLVSSINTPSLTLLSHATESGTTVTELARFEVYFSQHLYLSLTWAANFIYPAVSIDGINYAVLSGPPTSGFTPTQGGIVAGANTGIVFGTQMNVYDWKEIY